jgi:adenine-specific DNA methylase
VEKLWKEAIARLEDVPKDDLAGYAEAQKLLAEYKTNLGQVQIRRQAEAESVETLEQAQRQIERLLAYTPTDAKSLDRNGTMSQLQSIINQLEKVQNGTTAYLKAQELRLSAQNKLKQLQPKY